ncbi:MAG: sigma-70 family RNA polymerase sigma factor, partial [Planctomycetes bacterium]|nr:sigma-70 family RNA polymerase sigma factor [Planctomycetota bacterium]
MERDASFRTVEQLVLREKARAWRLAYGLTGNAADADDALQQACVIAVEKAAHVANLGDPWPWFAAVITNVARNQRRRKAYRKTEDIAERDVMGGMNSPETEAQKQELASRAFTAMQELHETERDAITLTHVSGMSYQDAATALDLPVGTVKSHVSRGLSTLRTRLGVEESVVARSFIALPIAMPGGGLDQAVLTWMGTAKASVVTTGAISGTSIGTGVAGGLIMANKVALVCAVAVGVGLGVAGSMAAPELLKEESSSQSDSTIADSTSEDESTRTTSDSPSQPANASTVDAEEYNRLKLELDRSRAELSASEAKRREAEERLGTATTNAPNSKERPGETVRHEPDASATKPDASFDSWRSNEDFKDVDWASVARTDIEVDAAINAMMQDHKEGESFEPDADIMGKLMAAAMSADAHTRRLKGRLPSTSSSPGASASHPYAIANLLTETLKAKGYPLSEDQLAQVERRGMQYDADWEINQARYNDQTMTLEKVLDEAELRHAFLDNVKNTILTSQQRDAIVGTEQLPSTSADLFNAAGLLTNMYAQWHKADRNELRTSMTSEIMSARWGVPADNTGQYDYLAADWVSTVSNDIVERAEPKIVTSNNAPTGGSGIVMNMKIENGAMGLGTNTSSYHRALRLGRAQLAAMKQIVN